LKEWNRMKIRESAIRYPLSAIFALAGSTLILFTLFTLLNMIFKQVIYHPEGLIEAISDPLVIRSIILTLFSSFLATLITIIFGTPLAYVLARNSFPGKTLIETFIDIPVIIPHSVAGIALYTLLHSRSAVGMAFDKIGIVFEDSLWGIIVAMLFVSTPFYVNAARDGFKAVDPRLEKVARTLGASEWKTFTKITLPLSMESLLSGAIMSWARGISEFGAVIIIAFYPMIAPVLIYYRFTTHGLIGSQPIAVLLILICLSIFFGLRFFSTKWGART